VKLSQIEHERVEERLKFSLLQRERADERRMFTQLERERADETRMFSQLQRERVGERQMFTQLERERADEKQKAQVTEADLRSRYSKNMSTMSFLAIVACVMWMILPLSPAAFVSVRLIIDVLSLIVSFGGGSL